MLLIFGGLPGTGKTTIARELAKKLPAMHLRIDTIEAAVKKSHITYDPDYMDAGYLVAFDVAIDNLKLGHTVIGDSVNPIPISRDGWRDTAKKAVDENCKRFEWIVLDSNTPSVELYRTLGAKPMDEWTIQRVTGDSLKKLATS